VPCDEADNPDLANLCKLEVVLESGSSKTVRVEFHRGHFKNPMTDAEMARKHLAANRVDDLLRLSWGIENEPLVSNLIASTRFEIAGCQIW
jgi:2-methylcitrate dehydratase